MAVIMILTNQMDAEDKTDKMLKSFNENGQYALYVSQNKLETSSVCHNLNILLCIMRNRGMFILSYCKQGFGHLYQLY